MAGAPVTVRNPPGQSRLRFFGSEPGPDLFQHRRSAARQIVVFERPGPGGNWVSDPPPRGATGAREWMIKRVVATPGDRIPAEILPALDGPGGSLVPPGKLVVLGDNTASSQNSRLIGYIPAERMLGVMLRAMSSSRTQPSERTPSNGGRMSRERRHLPGQRPGFTESSRRLQA